jgi:hypothetical protein
VGVPDFQSSGRNFRGSMIGTTESRALPFLVAVQMAVIKAGTARADVPYPLHCMELFWRTSV